MSNEVQVIHHDDAALVLGSSEAVKKFAEEVPGVINTLKPWMIEAAGKAIQYAVGEQSAVPAEAGVWVKVSQESLDKLPKGAAKDLAEGVFRGDKGQILNILKFDGSKVVAKAPGGKVVNPAVAATGPAVVAAVAVQVAIDQAVDELKEYLEEMDTKLVSLIRDNRIEKEANLESVIESLDKAEAYFEATGEVDSVTWDKIASAEDRASTVQRQALGNIEALVEDIIKNKGNTAKLRRALEKAEEDAPFWLQLLAVAMATYDRASILELAHRRSVKPKTLDEIRHVIEEHRTQRAIDTARTLNEVLKSIEESADLNAARRIRNAIESPKVVEAANQLLATVDTFSQYAGVELASPNELAKVGYFYSVKELGSDVWDSFDKRREAFEEKSNQRRHERKLRKKEKLEQKLKKIDNEIQSDE